MEMPKTSIIIENEFRSKDERGSILSIADAKISNVSIIKCKSQSLRSNHYHKTDAHFMYVLKGEINYFFKNLNDDQINYLKITKGQNIYTPPLEIHATYFHIETELVVSSINPRDQKTYEEDTVRVDFINNDNLQILLERFN